MWQKQNFHLVLWGDMETTSEASFLVDVLSTGGDKPHRLRRCNGVKVVEGLGIFSVLYTRYKFSGRAESTLG